MLFCWNPWILSYCFQHLTCQITEKRDFVWLRHRGKVTPTPYGKIGGIHGSSSHLHLKIPPGLKDLREKQLAFCGIVNFQVCPIDFPNTKPVPLTKPIYIYILYIYRHVTYVCMIIYVVQYMLYSSHVTSCHTRLHPHVISMARSGAARRGWLPGGLRSGGATSTAALSSRYRRGGVAMWRFFWGFSPWKVGQLLGDPEKLGKLHRVHGLAKALWVGAGPSWISRRDFTIKAAPCSPFPWYPAKVHDSVIVTIMELYG